MRQLELASRLAALQESATLALNAQAKQLAAEGRTIYNLTAGELATDTPGYIQAAVAKQLAQNKYTPVAGLSELRQAIADHSGKFYDLDWIKSDNVIVTAGAKPALFATLLALLNPGDEVIVPVPAWSVSYFPLIELAGGKIRAVSLSDNFDVDVASIKRALNPKTKAIIINSPSNPTGAVFSESRLRQLAKILNDTQVTVIADDIYSKLVYVDDFRPVPSCGFDNVVIINGFSKSQALTGWRIGYLIADTKIAKAATSLLSHITGNAPLPSQLAGLAAMKHNDQPPESTISDLKQRRQLVLNGLQDSAIKFMPPAGAFYFWLDLRAVTNDSAGWCAQLLEQAGVALVPGEAFGAPGFARLTFVADEKTLTSAITAIKKFAEVQS